METIDEFEFLVLRRVYYWFTVIFMVTYALDLAIALWLGVDTRTSVYSIVGLLVNAAAIPALATQRNARARIIPTGTGLLLVNLAYGQAKPFLHAVDEVSFAAETLLYPMAILALGFFAKKKWVPIVGAVATLALFIVVHFAFPALVFPATVTIRPERNVSLVGLVRILFISLSSAVLFGTLLNLFRENYRRKKEYFDRLSFLDQETGLPNVRELTRVVADRDDLTFAGIRLLRLEEMGEKLGYENMLSWLKRFSGELSATLDLWRRGLGAPDASPLQLYRLESAILVIPMSLSPEQRTQTADIAKSLAAAVSETLRAEHVDSLIDFYGALSSCPEDGDSCSQILSNVLNLLHRAMPTQKGSFIAFNPFSFDQYLRGERLREQMVSLSFTTEVAAVFQPKLATLSETCTEFEALARWNNPILGSISPCEFIPIAERVGAMTVVTERILSDTRRFVERCKAAGYTDVRIAVNLSPSLISKEYLANLAAWVTDNDLGRALELEITEGILLATSPETEQGFDLLRKAGVTFAIDDFGTGYSNLAYLQHFHAEIVKIDKSFVDGLPDNEKSENLVRAIVLMAKAFGMKTVAEGAENAGQLEKLREVGCDFIQGYYYSKPLTMNDALRFVSSHSVEFAK